MKDRCTFTASNSFLTPFAGARATPEKVARFKARVAEMLEPGGGLSEPDRLKLRAQGTALADLFARLDEMAAIEAEGDPTRTGFPADQPMDHFLQSNLLRGIDPTLTYQLATAAMDCFMEKPVAGSDRVTTPERMSHLIPAISDAALKAIQDGQDPQRINLPVGNYAEAQVYGGVNLASDVAEICFIDRDTRQMNPQQKAAYLDAVQGMRRMADELGVRVVRYTPEEAGLTS